jgi:hypothetical protein
MAQKSSRSYSERTLKILWGRGAGRCSIPTCRIELFAEATEHDPMVVIGEIAHIEASSDSGPRANKAKSRKERDEYDNLILLCKNCHARLDGQKNANSVERINKLKEDHEDWVRNSLPERGRGTTGWAVLLLQGPHSFDLEPAITALLPDFPIGDPVIVKADPEVDSWDAIDERLRATAAEILGGGDPFDFRLAVFALAPVSACVGLGYYLTNRPRVRLFQFQRDDHSWSWFDEPATPSELRVSGLREAAVDDAGDLAICFELSAPVEQQNLDRLGVEFIDAIRVGIPEPTTAWLRRPEQLKDLARSAREVFERASNRYPNVARWHLFYAGPAPGGVVIGQQINPTMCPSVQLYEYRRNQTPSHRPSFVIG